MPMLTPSQYSEGLNELPYFPFQFERLKEYLEKHKGMKLNATVKYQLYILVMKFKML